jgi:hypothetical protein
MSKLLDRLDKLARGPSTPMGFGASSRVEKLPAIGLLASVTQEQAANGAVSSSGVDGILIKGSIGESQLNSLLAQVGDLPWGVEVDGLNEGTASGYVEQGADFFRFGANGVEVGALSEEDPGYLLSLPLDLEERVLRGIEDLPVDGVVLSVDAASLPLDLSQLMVLSAVRCMFNKYLLVELPGVVGAGELRGLRDIGVDAVILDVSAVEAGQLAEFQENLLNLPRQRKARAGKAEAMLPRNTFHVPAPARQDDDDEEDE